MSLNTPIGTPKREIAVTGEEAGLTLIQLLCKRFTYFNIDKWRQQLDDDRFLINQNSADGHEILQKGDRIIYYPPRRPEPPVNSRFTPLYEDSDLLIINKPPDLPCHPGGIYLKHTLWWLLREQYGEEIYLIQRLDRETSGAMGIAKNRDTARFYYHALKERRTEKNYLVLVEGQFPEAMTTQGWLQKDPHSRIRKKRIFIPDQTTIDPKPLESKDKQWSLTDFTRIKSFDDGTSLLNARLHTGKTHQIRATLHSLGWPVVGDKLYGIDPEIFLRFPEKKVTAEDRSALRMPFQALHSWKLTLPNQKGGTISVMAELPEGWIHQR